VAHHLGTVPQAIIEEEACNRSLVGAHHADAGGMRVTPGRLMLLSLFAGVLVLAAGAWVGGNSLPHPTETHTFRLSGGSAGDAWYQPWAGRMLSATPWAFAACGVGFIAAAIWLAWRDSRSWPKSHPAAAGDPARDMGERKP
jgi:hypothetical protein